MPMDEYFPAAGAGAGPGFEEAEAMEGVEPGAGPVLVSGTPGGVGSVATVLLSQLGYSVTAVTGPGGSHADFLK